MAITPTRLNNAVKLWEWLTLNPTFRLSLPQAAKHAGMASHTAYRVVEDFPNSFINKNGFCFAVGTRPSIDVSDLAPTPAMSGIPNSRLRPLSEYTVDELVDIILETRANKELVKRGYDLALIEPKTKPAKGPKATPPGSQTAPQFEQVNAQNDTPGFEPPIVKHPTYSEDYQ